MRYIKIFLAFISLSTALLLALPDAVNAVYYTEEEIRAVLVDSGMPPEGVDYAVSSIYKSQKTEAEFRAEHKDLPTIEIKNLFEEQDVLASYKKSTPNDCSESFLGLPAWYRGLTDSKCDIVSPNSDGISSFIWHIVLNIIQAVVTLVAYVAAGFIIYGGFLYLTSQGDSANVTKAKASITNAVIGLVMAIIATAAVEFIFTSLIKAPTGAIVRLSASDVVGNILNMIYTITGIIAVFVIIFAGISYVTSQGDSAKVAKAKNAIIYAVVGLVVIVLAFVITRFVMGRLI